MERSSQMDKKRYKVAVVSDSHGTSQLVKDIEMWNADADLFIHCGDLEDDPNLFDKWIFVRGNNDFFPGGNMKDERIIRIGEHRIYVTHSHRCSYAGRERQLSRIALQNGCDIVCFGHTHCSEICRENGVLLVNPGSTWSPRDGKEPSYAILYLEGLQTEAELVFEPDWPLTPKEEPVRKHRFFHF